MFRLATAFSLTLCLSACSAEYGPLGSAEQRINAALPLSESLLNAKESLDRSYGGARNVPPPVAQQWQARAALRALTCAKGYSPGPLTSAEDTRSHFADRSCFLAFDQATSRWLSEQRIARLMALPPLRPIPETVPRFIVSRESGTSFQFADAAGIAIVMSSRKLEVLDIGTSDVIFSEPRNGNIGGVWPSANGRLFIENNRSSPMIRDSESGDVLLELPDFSELRWMGPYVAGVSRADSQSLRVMDLQSNDDVPIAGVHGSFSGLVPVPEQQTQFVIATSSTVQIVDVQRRDGVLHTQLISAAPATSPAVWASNSGAVNADGRYYASGFPELSLTSLTTLRATNYRLESLQAQQAIPTPDPDQIILTAVVKGMPGYPRTALLISLSTLEAAVVDSKAIGNATITYIKPLKRLGLVQNGRVEIVDSVPTGPSRSFDELNDSFRSQVSAATTAAATSAFNSEGSLSVSAAPVLAPIPVLAALARDADVEAIGVYEGNSGLHRPGTPSGPGDVIVRVKKSRRPLVLVLASYSKVHWELRMDSGARVPLLLLSSYEGSDVTGAHVARTVVIGQQYAYQRGSQQYGALDAAVAGSVGKHIDVFQGTYRGTYFTVGDSSF